MNQHMPPSRATILRPALLATIGVVILAVTVGVVLHESGVPTLPFETASTSRDETGTSRPALPPAASTPEQAPGPKPSFDVVRINPEGGAVMAGRAAPGSKVIIYDAGKPVGEVQADQNGDWVFSPENPLPPGSRELTLAQRLPDGTETKGPGSVVLMVPPPAPATGGQHMPALAVLTGPNTAPGVLTGPAGETDGRLSVGAMEYDRDGEVRFSGAAPPGAAVRLYIDNHPVGGVVADQQGKWSLTAHDAPATGSHKLRLDQIGQDGAVAARLEQSFDREELASMQPPPGQIRIQPGQNLWLIAKSTYGQGVRYLVIFQANRTQIRDPNLIYPGQVFALPSGYSGAAMPESSSTSR